MGDTTVGLYSGLTKDQVALGKYNQDFTQTTSSGPSTSTTNSFGTEVSNQVTNTSTSSSQINTTPTILASLEEFIKTMMDRPAISQAELAAAAPYAIQQYDRNSGWSWIDPSSNRRLSDAEAQTFNAAQGAKREQMIQQAGVIRGGTADQRATSDARMLEIERNRATQGKYTKEAAFADAQSLSGYFQRVLAESQLPGITRGAEGAGTSQGSMRTLLQSRAAEVTGEQAAKLGLEAAVQYGGINNQLAATLEALTRADPNSISAQLLQALSIGKGIASAGSQNQSSATSGVKDSVGTAIKTSPGETQTTTKNFTEQSPASQVQQFAPPVGIPQLSGTFGTVSRDPVLTQMLNGLDPNFPNTPPIVPPQDDSGISYYGGDGQFIYD